VPGAEDERRIIIAPVPNRLSDLVDILPKPKRTLTIEEMDAAIGGAAVERFYRAVGSKR
jgi:hypothetical protein